MTRGHLVRFDDLELLHAVNRGNPDHAHSFRLGKGSCLPAALSDGHNAQAGTAQYKSQEPNPTQTSQQHHSGSVDTTFGSSRDSASGVCGGAGGYR